MAKSHHRRAASHCLDHHQTERLRPIDGKQQRSRLSQEAAFLILADLAQELDVCFREQRLQLAFVEVTILVVYLRGDFERQAQPAGDLHGTVDPLLRRNPPQERQVLSGVRPERI